MEVTLPIISIREILINSYSALKVEVGAEVLRPVSTQPSKIAIREAKDL